MKDRKRLTSNLTDGVHNCLGKRVDVIMNNLGAVTASAAVAVLSVGLGIGGAIN